MNKEKIVEKLAEWICISEQTERFLDEIAEWYIAIKNNVPRDKIPKLPDLVDKGKESWEELVSYKDVEHHGDCVDIPSACIRCHYEDLMDMARKELLESK